MKIRHWLKPVLGQITIRKSVFVYIFNIYVSNIWNQVQTIHTSVFTLWGVVFFDYMSVFLFTICVTFVYFSLDLCRSLRCYRYIIKLFENLISICVACYTLHLHIANCMFTKVYLPLNQLNSIHIHVQVFLELHHFPVTWFHHRKSRHFMSYLQ